MHTENRRPNLPPADPWDKRTGVKPVTDFEVDCEWIPLDEDWALLRVYINIRGERYLLVKDTEVYRVKRETRSGLIELPELTALSWTERAVGAGGVQVLGMHERSPGHSTSHDGIIRFRWWARVGARLSVAVVRLSGDLEGQVRLVPVN